MITQYHILTLCLWELARSTLHTTQKLQLEAQLYQLKRLVLIDEVAEMIKGDPGSERAFRELNDRIKHLCSRDCQAGEVEETLAYIMEMKVPALVLTPQQ